MSSKATNNPKTSRIIKSFKLLEDRMVRYSDLIDVPVKEKREKFVFLKASEVPNGYVNEMKDMEKIVGPQILVRKTIYQKLKLAQNILIARHPDLTLYVTYGYRSLEIQTDRFLKVLSSVDGTFFPDPSGLYEAVHRNVAVPTVAGHPTGGAIDIMIKNITTNRSIDFGSEQYNYLTKDSYVYSPNITKIQRNNRILLRDVLLGVGFAPFDGEWWHFSYGDREWAFYYKKKYAIYSQMSLEKIKFLENS